MVALGPVPSRLSRKLRRLRSDTGKFFIVAFAASFLKEAGPGARPLVVGGVGGGLQAELLEGADDVGLDVGARLGAHNVRDGVGFEGHPRLAPRGPAALGGVAVGVGGGSRGPQ